MKLRTLFFIFLLGLQACSEPDELKSLVVEFPEPETAQVLIETQQTQLQYLIPVAELNQPELLKKRMAQLAPELQDEVFAMMAAIEPPPPPTISEDLSQSVEALSDFLGSLGADVKALQKELESNSQQYEQELEQHMGELSDKAKGLAQQARDKAKGVVGQIKHQYVLHLIELIEQDKLTDEQIQLLEKALVERHRRMKNE